MGRASMGKWRARWMRFLLATGAERQRLLALYGKHRKFRRP